VGIHNVIAGRLTPGVHAVLDDPLVRNRAMWHGQWFGEAFDDALLVSVDRSGVAPALIPETRATARALAPDASGWYRRAGDVLRRIVDYAERSGRPIEGLGMGTTAPQFVAARATSALHELAHTGTLDAERAYRTIRSTGCEPSLFAVHERGRIFLTPLVTNVLLHPEPARIHADTARAAVNVVDHELGHARNARTSQPLASGSTAESVVELRTQVGEARIAPFQRDLGFASSTTPRRTFYEQPVQWLRGVFQRAGSITDAEIAADLARQPDDRMLLTELAARLLDRNGIDPSWIEPAVSSLRAPEAMFRATAEQQLARLDGELAATARGVTYQDWLRTYNEQQQAAKLARAAHAAQ
jgi:hypothetical protein